MTRPGHTLVTDDHWNAEDYATHASFVAQLNDEVLKDLSPRRNEKILDLGCGNGQLTEALIHLGCDVTGIDSSPGLIDVARSRGLRVQLGDAQNLEFDNTFDAVFSNAAMHWMPRQDEIARRVYRALKPGGRFVAEMGGAGNIRQLCKAIDSALGEIGLDLASRNPWTFPTADEQHTRLTQAGFHVTKCTLRDRPTVLPTDIRGWLETFSQSILADLDTHTRNSVIDRIVELSRPTLCDDAGIWTVDYVRLNFIALKNTGNT